MARKTVRFNKGGVGKLPQHKPVLYRIQTEGSKDNYVGIAKRGRVQARITEHLGEIPGAKVQVEQMSRIQDARTKEARLIVRGQPKYNKHGK